MAEPLAFADILNLLFTYRTKADGSPYKASEVFRATGVSQSQLSLLLSGQRPNTSIEIARTLIRFFDVSFDVLNATSEQEVINMIARTQPKAESTIRLRGKMLEELSPQAVRQIEQLVQYVLEREHAVRHGHPEPPLPRLNENSGDSSD